MAKSMVKKWAMYLSGQLWKRVKINMSLQSQQMIQQHQSMKFMDRNRLKQLMSALVQVMGLDSVFFGLFF